MRDAIDQFRDAIRSAGLSSPDTIASNENGLRLYRRIFVRKQSDGRKSLNRQSLPTPLQYLTERGLFKGKARSE